MLQSQVICLGAGVTGLSCARFLEQRGFEALVTDDNPEKAQVPLKTVLSLLAGGKICFVVTSPGVKLTHPLLALAREMKVQVIGDIELGLTFMPQVRPKLIGITGSNGKTTVASLVEHIVRFSGRKAIAVGNIGNAFLDDFEARLHEDALIVEISSQQLEHTYTPLFDAACIVNITPNHLDWHGSWDAYVQAKLKLTHLIGNNPLFVKDDCTYHLPGAMRIGERGDLKIVDGKIIFLGRIEGICGKTLLSSFAHDKENFLFAYAIAKELGVDPDTAIAAFESFVKPAHRIQFIGRYRGVSYYDDSKATSVAAVIQAVQVVPAPIQLIAGGVHKGEPYHAWIPHFRDRVQHVFAIGEARGIIQRDLHPDIKVAACESFDEAFISAQKVAKEGGSVLLSPGCSSFDMFASYKERGGKFQSCVMNSV